MARPSNGVQAAQAALASGGRYAPTTPLTQVSPLVESYQSSALGRADLLPRPPGMFQAAFGPNPPLWPMTIDEVTPDTGQPTPRRVQYPVSWNLPVGVPGTEGLGKLAPFNELRNLADRYSIARACLDRRIQEIIGLTWDIVPTPAAEKAMSGSNAARSTWEKRKSEVMEFWMRPDRSPDSPYTSYEDLMRAFLEDHLVCDAVAIHPVRPRGGKGKGVCGSTVASLTLCDGTLFRPLYDVLGGAPPSPAPAYQQFLWGVPRVDYTTIATGQDIATMEDALVGTIKSNDLLYLIREARTWAPYGQSCIEKALIPIQIGFARQNMQLQYFTTGTVPYMFVVPGQELISSPQQIRMLQNALNNFAGDTGWKQKIIVLPPNSKTEMMKPNDLADQFDEFIIACVTMAFGYSPMDIGIAPKVAAIQSPAASKQMSNIAATNSKDRWLEPETEWLSSKFFTRVTQKMFGQDDMMWKWTGMEQAEELSDKVGTAVSLVKTAPILSVDEAREMIGYDPFGLPETSVPLVITGTGAVPLSTSVQQAQFAAAPPGTTTPPPGAPVTEGKPETTVGTGDGIDQGSSDTGRIGSDGELTSPMQQAAQDVVATGHVASTKAAEAELATLGRLLRKGRSLEDFRTVHLSENVLMVVKVTLGRVGPNEAIEAGKEALRAEWWASTKSVAVNHAASKLLAALANEAQGARKGRWNREAAIAKAQQRWANAVALTHEYAVKALKTQDHDWPDSFSITVPHSDNVKRFVETAFSGRASNEIGKAIAADLAAVYQRTVEMATKGIKAKDVVTYLDKQYPGDDLHWVTKCDWDQKTIPLATIDYPQLPKEQDQQKIDAKVASIKNGTPINPIVVVHTGPRKETIVDGRHRTLAYEKLERTTIPAWIGTPKGDIGDWRKTVEDMEAHALIVDAEQAKKGASAGTHSPNSGMVSLDVPEGTIPTIKTGVQDHHITIVFLGSDVDVDTYEAVCKAVEEVASNTPGPVKGTLGGIGSFPPSESSDGLKPVWTKPDITGIETLRAPLEKFNASQHADFHPHITLAYVEPTDDLPPALKDTPVSFTHLSVHRGDAVKRFPFGTTTKIAKQSKMSVNYRPKDKPGESCLNCIYMNTDGTCDKVKGIVEPDYTCDLWEGEVTKSPKAPARKGQAQRLELADKIEAHYAPKIQDALKVLTTGYRTAIRTALSQAKGRKAATTIPAQMAQQIALGAVKAKVKATTQPLAEVLKSLGIDSWLAGSWAGQALGGKLPDEAMSFLGDMDWATWTPGNPGGAAQAFGTGLANLLDQQGVIIKTITDTQLSQISDAIAQGLVNGNNLATITQAVTAIRTNPYRSNLIARTETNRAQTEATMQSYQNAGIEKWKLITSPTPCPECEALEERSATTPFTMGTEQPPIHPQCRCDAVPVITIEGQTAVTGSSDEDLAAAQGISVTEFRGQSTQ